MRPGQILMSVWILVMASLPGAVAEAASRVVFVVPAQGVAASRLSMALRAQFEDLTVELLVESSTVKKDMRSRIAAARSLQQQHHALGVFWLDLADDALLYLFEPRSGRVLLRSMPWNTTAPTAVIEEIAVIVRSLTRALVEGRTVGMEPTEPLPEAHPPPEPSTPTPTHRWLSLSGGYGAAALSDEIPWQSGLVVGVTVQPLRYFHLSLGYTATTGVDLGLETARARIQRHPFELVAGCLLSWGRWSAGGELGVFAERVQRETLETAVNIDATAAAAHWAFGLVPRLRAEVALWSRVSLFMTLGVDVLLQGVSYVVQTQQGDTVADPWAVRPRMELGVLVRVL